MASLDPGTGYRASPFEAVRVTFERSSPSKLGGKTRRVQSRSARRQTPDARRHRSPGGQGGSSSSAITRWVKAHYKTVTVGGQTLYDLT